MHVSSLKLAEPEFGYEDDTIRWESTTIIFRILFVEIQRERENVISSFVLGFVFLF